MRLGLLSSVQLISASRLLVKARLFRSPATINAHRDPHAIKLPDPMKVTQPIYRGSSYRAFEPGTRNRANFKILHGLGLEADPRVTLSPRWPVIRAKATRDHSLAMG